MLQILISIKVADCGTVQNNHLFGPILSWRNSEQLISCIVISSQSDERLAGAS
jgi:hypothetical protein